MPNPAGPLMKSKPLWMPRMRMFSSVLENRYAPAAKTSPSTITWYSKPRKALLRQDQDRVLGGAVAMQGQGPSQTNPVSSLLSHRRGVHEAALAPQAVRAARQLQRRLGSHVALEDLAVVAHRLDRAIGPVLVEAEQLAGVFTGAEDALHHRILALGFHLVDVGLRDAVFLGLDQREHHPLGDSEELIIAAAHGRAERLLGDQLGQDHVVLGIA